MTRRWIIRGFLIGLLLLLTAAWPWSYVYREIISFERNAGTYRSWEANLAGGKVILLYGRCEWLPFTPLPEGLGFSHSTYSYYDFAETLIIPPTEDARLLGFRYCFCHDPPVHYRFIELPCWFITVVSISLFCLVWRKSRPIAQGRSFPVVVPPATDHRDTAPTIDH